MNPGNSRDKDKPQAKGAENENTTGSLPASAFKQSRFGSRHVQILYVFACMTLTMSMRSNFSVAIVAMIDNTTSINPNVPVSIIFTIIICYQLKCPAIDVPMG